MPNPDHEPSRRQMRRMEIQTKKRNRFILTGAATALGAAAIVGGLLFARAQDQSPPHTPTPPTRPLTPENTTVNNEQRVRQEVIRLGIQENSKEKELWEKKGYNPLPPSEITTQSIVLAEERIIQTLAIMEESENPHFKSAVEFYKTQVKLGKVSIKAYRRVYSNLAESLIVIGPEIREGELHYHFAVSADAFLHDMSTLTAAITVSHEIEHLKNFLEAEKNLGSMNVEQKLEKLKPSLWSLDTNVEEEARAYGAETKAYIHHYGLTRFKDDGALTKAAIFIQSDNNPSHIQWRTHIGRNVLGVNYTPRR